MTCCDHLWLPGTTVWPCLKSEHVGAAGRRAAPAAVKRSAVVVFHVEVITPLASARSFKAQKEHHQPPHHQSNAETQGRRREHRNLGD